MHPIIGYLLSTVFDLLFTINQSKPYFEAYMVRTFILFKIKTKFVNSDLTASMLLSLIMLIFLTSYLKSFIFKHV